jgi:GTP-binding protein HflX
LLVLNKIDALPDHAARSSLINRYPHAVCVSAYTGEGLGGLERATTACLSRGFRDVDIQTDPGNGRLLAWLNAHGEVLSRHFVEDRVTIHCRIPAAMLGRIPPDEASVVPHESPAERLSRDGAAAQDDQP